ncbi:hotdog fold thioesterase [Actinokineospora diospyrosa]|uniref:Domain 1-containing protein n=1 Tax=Actinokineospora diospyrosa TaxID=103728 RepID=A0ABT1I6F2_9PSEU|nr:hotdog fold thioesterase [Actinokineospora diospyrosa]MCP2268196.1 putative domain 1-containing protein [Actinokineospora diospyrosa]
MSGIDRDKLPGLRAEVADQFLPDKLGIDVTDWTPTRLVGTMPVKGNLQPYGLLHGGANAVLAETLGSIAAVLNAPTGKLAVGLELSCTHHRAVRTGQVTAVCTPLHIGRTTSTFEIVITDDQDRRTCTARLTCVIIAKAPGDPS